MIKLYRSRGKYYKHHNGRWLFWCRDRWVISEDANNMFSNFHLRWRNDLQLIGNNYKLK